MAIPFDRLGIPEQFHRSVGPDAPRKAKVVVAKGLLPAPPEVQLALLYVLATDDDKGIAKLAQDTFKSMPVSQLLAGISQRTFPKIIELIARNRTDEPEIDIRLTQMRSTPDRVIVRIAKRATAGLCEALTRNHERMLITPELFIALHGNPACTDEHLAAAKSFLRMHRSLPEVPDKRPFVKEEPVVPVAAPAPKARPAADDLSSLFGEDDADASPAAAAPPPPPTQAPKKKATMKLQAPADEGLEMLDLESLGGAEDLGTFSFDFEDDMKDFSWDLTDDADDDDKEEEEEENISMERRIEELTVGQRIKLAYLGNKQARKILIRDPNKIVSSAVVRSGRLSPNEVASYAGNKNLADDVLREIASSPEFTRKYPVRVALVNNPKTPPALAIRFIAQLAKKDLQQLSNNRNVGSAIFGTAKKLFKQKYRK